MLVNTVMEPRKRSVGRLVMMLTTRPPRRNRSVPPRAHGGPRCARPPPAAPSCCRRGCRVRRASRSAPSCASLTGLPSTRIRVFSGPMPRMSICRLLPRWPLELLPVRLTPGMVRMISERSFTGGRFLMSSAVMMDTPGACLSSCSAVPSTTSSPSWTTDSARSSSSSRRSSSARACPPSRLDEAKGRQRRDGRDGIGVHA